MNRAQMEDMGKSWDNWLKKWITPRSIAYFTTILYVLSLIPLLLIARYNYPSADDYSIGSNCRQVWVGTHNIFAVLWEGVVRAVQDWCHWMGYFTSNFLMAVPPSTFGERWYVLTTWLMLGMLSFSEMYLFRAVLVKMLKGDRYSCHSISMLVLFVQVQCMCPVGRVEAFFWYSGAVNYIFVHSMSLFFLGLMISVVYDKGKRRVRDLMWAAFLGFFTGGGNQMTALNIAVVLLAAFGVMAIGKKWREARVLSMPFALFYFGFALNVAAPGNWVRAEGARGMDPAKAVLVSFYVCLDRMMGEWTTWAVIVAMAALVPLFWHIAAKTSFGFPYPLAVVAFGYCLASAMVTPPLFAMGNMEAGRLQALAFLMYIQILSLCVGYVTGWVRKRLEGRERTALGDHSFTLGSCWHLLGCLAFLLFGSLLTLVPDPHYYTFSSAVVDLANGNAQIYGEALEERMGLYRAGEGGIIWVEPLPSHPVLLYFSDIKEEPQDWENQGLSRYYGVEGVAVKSGE